MQILLRKCTTCGLEANSEAELELFKKGKVYRYGRMPFCKQCANKTNRKDGKYYLSRLMSSRRSHCKENPKRITFEGKRIQLKDNPRTNVCHNCGRKYPEELRQQTAMHHIEYNSEDPLAFTVELCFSCHTSFHNQLRKLSEKKVEA